MIRSDVQAEKVALVTGSARRVGAAIIQVLHKAGYKTAIHCYEALDEALSLAALLNQKRAESAHVFPCNLLEKGAATQLIADVSAWAKRLDVLVNNASLFIETRPEQIDDKVWHQLFMLNVQVPFVLSQAAKPWLAANTGVIVNITDIHAEKPLKNYAVYCQTKAALVMQTKALAKEFAPEVRVNAVAPGAVMWPEDENALSDAQKQAIIAKTPLRCHGHPRYIAAAVQALIDNPFITGQILAVDGGRSIA